MAFAVVGGIPFLGDQRGGDDLPAGLSLMIGGGFARLVGEEWRPLLPNLALVYTPLFLIAVGATRIAARILQRRALRLINMAASIVVGTVIGIEEPARP